MNETVTISVKELKDMCLRRFRAAGVPEDEAEIMAESLVQADRRGVGSHGVVCVSRYVRLMKEGFMRPKEEHEVIRGMGVVEVWDGKRSSGQVLGHRAMLRAMEIARTSGVGVVAVKGGNHFGAGAYYAMLAEQAGMIGLAASTGSPTMAPWGGADRRIGNNPVAVAVPAKEHPPVVLDMAQSVVAFGRVNNMKRAGYTEVPAGWCLDKDGLPTTRIEDVVSVAPMAGYKGYGIAVLVDILSGVLFGGGTGARAADQAEGPAMIFAAMNVAAFSEPEQFAHDLDARIDELKQARPAPGAGGILMPGELEHGRAVQASENVTLLAEILKELQAVPE